MDIVRNRQERRLSIINRIVMTLSKAKKEVTFLSYEDFTKKLCFEYGMARRTARELLDIALHHTHSEVNVIDGRLAIVPKNPINPEIKTEIQKELEDEVNYFITNKEDNGQTNISKE